MNNTGSQHLVFNAYENVRTNSVFWRVNFAEMFLFMKKMCHNWQNNNKSLNFQMQRILERSMLSFLSKNGVKHRK